MRLSLSVAQPDLSKTPKVDVGLTGTDWERASNQFMTAVMQILRSAAIRCTAATPLVILLMLNLFYTYPPTIGTL